MLNVNNKRAIAKLANKSYKANKLRNLFAIIAIILTTLLFTTLFTVSINLMKSFEEETMRQVGGRSHAGLKYLTKEQYEKMSTHPLIKEVGYTVVLGFAENKELISRQTEIRYANGDWIAKEMFSYPQKGTMPKAIDEIALDTITLDLLNIPYELGQNIKLEYSLNGQPQTDSFKLVGYWEGDRVSTASQAWLSREYVEKRLENLKPEQNNNAIGTYNANINFANSRNIESNIEAVVTESGFSLEEILIGINWAYLSTSQLDIGTVLGAVGALILIILCGYLIISNIFLISVTRDIRFYGLLKTIGTTSKQLRALIAKQAQSLCVVGIPMGLICGYVVGVWLTPLVMSILTVQRVTFSANPIIFIGSALFAMITVFISTAKAARLAGKVSPIEALRSTESVNMKKTSRKSGGVNIPKVGIANVFRSKKKAIFVTLSLSLSLIILNSTFSIVNSFDLDKYTSHFINSDFVLSDVSRGNFSTDYYNRTVSKAFLTDVSSQKGIEKLSNVYNHSDWKYKTDEKYNEAVKKAVEIIAKESPEHAHNLQESLDGLAIAQIYGIDEYGLGKLKMFSDVDAEKFMSGGYVIAAPFFTSGEVPIYSKGDKISINTAGGDTKEYEVLATGIMPYGISSQVFFGSQVEFILPEDEYLSIKTDALPMISMLEVSPEYEQIFESFLHKYTEKNKDCKYISKAVIKAEFENMQKTYLLVGGILSFIMAFIGIMNFTNTMITLVIARRREFAMLQSIGMTGRQLKEMLVSEGLTYTFLTILVVLSIGSVISYALVNLVAGGTIMFSAHFSVLPVLLCLPILVAFAVIVPIACYKTANRDSVVERLREAE